MVVNAVSYQDIEIFSVALIRAMQKGKKFILRSAAGIVKVMGGISDKDLLSKKEMRRAEDGGGLVIVGSHTEKTTKQLEKLLELPYVIPIELDATLVRDEKKFDAEIKRCIEAEQKILDRKSVV